MAIQAAALELFAERGFHGTTMPALAERAGVAAGTIYRYFESKEALVNELYASTKRDLLTRLLHDFPFDAEPREQFRAFWWRLAAFARSDPQAFAFLELHHHASYLSQENLTLERAAFLPVLAFLEDTRARKITKPISSEALIAIVWGAFAGLVKADRLQHMTLTDDVIAQAEGCCWDALRR